MLHRPAPRKFNWLGFIATLAIPALCLLFAVPAFLSDNLLFATNAIPQKPYQVVLYYDGESYVYEPGDREYGVLVDAAYATLATQNGFQEWGWSDTRFQQARIEGDALEFLYLEPVKIPGNRLDIADTYRLFFPLDVFGWDAEVVFRGGDSSYWGAPIRVDNFDELRGAVAEVVSAP